MSATVAVVMIMSSFSIFGGMISSNTSSASTNGERTATANPYSSIATISSSHASSSLSSKDVKIINTLESKGFDC